MWHYYEGSKDGSQFWFHAKILEKFKGDVYFNQYFTGHRFRRENSNLTFPFLSVKFKCHIVIVRLLVVVSHLSTLCCPLLWLFSNKFFQLVECSNITQGGKEQWPLCYPSHPSKIAMVPSSTFTVFLRFGADGCIVSSCLGTHWKTSSTKG